MPDIPWLVMLGAGMLLFLLLVGGLEWRLAARGYEPTVRDSAERWLEQRAKASALGERALILVGASRIQLGLDLDVLREETGLEPVQLALDGSAGDPILSGLARDGSIRGTILVDYYDHGVGSTGGAAARMQQLYEAGAGHGRFFDHPGLRFESWLTRWVREHLASFADGANPMQSLLRRAISDGGGQYLVTRPDRSRRADYSRTTMPGAYYARVARTLGENVDLATPDVGAALARRIASLSPEDNRAFTREARRVGREVAAIRERGGRVIFVAMPSSGMVRQIEEKRYPRERFWDVFLKEAKVPGIHSAYEPDLQAFHCPDGSHLDVRDQSTFTRRLVDVLRRQGVLPAAETRSLL